MCTNYGWEPPRPKLAGALTFMDEESQNINANTVLIISQGSAGFGSSRFITSVQKCSNPVSYTHLTLPTKRIV